MGEKRSKWYALRCISGKERSIKTYIENELERTGFRDQVGQILIPSEKVYELRGGKKRQREKSFMPGYLLLEIFGETMNPDLAQVIESVPNVLNFIRSERSRKATPIPLSDEEIARILRRINAEEEVKLENPFKVGQRVKIIQGAFKDLEGEIEEIDEEKQILRVTINIFGRKTPIEIDFTHVETIDRSIHL